MKKITIILIFSFLMLFSIKNFAKTIVLKLDPNKHCLDEKKRGQYLRATLKPKTRYYVRILGRAWLSGQSGRRADPVHGVITYYRAYKNGKNTDDYRVLKNKDRFVFVSATKNPVFVAFIMEIYSRRNNRGGFRITLRELGPVR